MYLSCLWQGIKLLGLLTNGHSADTCCGCEAFLARDNLGSLQDFDQELLSAMQHRQVLS